MKLQENLIDENLHWKNHIDFVGDTISKNIGLLFRASLHLNEKCLTQIYCITYPFVRKLWQYCMA